MMRRKRRKGKRKKPACIEVGKLKLSREEWETRTALTDYFKPGKIEVKLIEAKPKEKEPNETVEIKLIEIPKNQTNDEGGDENEKNN